MAEVSNAVTKPLKRLERQYVAYYLFNIMRTQGGRQYTMSVPASEPRMMELRELTAVIADLQGNVLGAQGIRRRLAKDYD